MRLPNVLAMVFAGAALILVALLPSLGAQSTRTELRVALFPYLPDPLNNHNETLRHFVEQEFERAYPNVDVHIRPMNQADDLYDSKLLKRWLSRTGSGPHYDLVEIDAVLLGEILEQIAPWPNANTEDWLPAAAQAVTDGGKVMGIPHWLCGHYVISRTATSQCHS